MKNKIALVMMAALSGCESSPVLTETTDSGEDAPTALSGISAGGSFTTKTAHAKVLVKQGGGAIHVGDLANGLATVGDTASEPKRVAISFAISDLAGKSLKGAQLNLYFDGRSSAFTSLGSLKAYQVNGTNALDQSSYAAAESLLGEVTYLGISNSAQVTVDIQDALQAAIDQGEQYFTVKLRFDNESSSGNNAVNFYCNYTSEPLAGMIPSISGEF